MKIVHLCLGNFFIDNYSYQENILPKYHVKMGYEVTVMASLVSFDEKGRYCLLKNPSTRIDKDGYKVIRLDYRSPITLNKIFRHYSHFEKMLFEEAPDLIFIHGLQFSDLDAVIRYKRRKPQTKIFADNHADFINSAHGWLSEHILHKFLWRRHIKRAEPYIEKCFGVTPLRCIFMREMYKFNAEKLFFLPMGVDDESIPEDKNLVRKNVRRDLGVGTDDFLIFTGGKIDRQKGTHILMEALSRIDNPHIHLVICGVLTPQMEYLKKAIEDLPAIHYLGWCNAEQVMKCMVASDMACFPGTHSTLWEQVVGVGLPAIFKRWDNMEHVCINDNCMFVKGEDVEELASTIKSMSFPKTYERYKQRAEASSGQFKYSEISKTSIGL